jgi:hypothetical protein
LINWKGFGRIWSWPTQGTILVFVWVVLRKIGEIAIRITGVWTEIRTENPPDTDLKLYSSVKIPSEADGCSAVMSYAT